MKILLTEAQLMEGVERIARKVNEYYDGRPLIVIGVLTGSVMLLADLIRRLKMPLRVGLLQARSYRGTNTRPGSLTISAEFLPEIRGHEVLLVDDIFDTGRTLFELISQLDELGPASVRTAVLLRKTGRTEVPFDPDYVAFEIPNVFVVGYGMDYDDVHRNLAYVAQLEPSDMPPERRS